MQIMYTEHPTADPSITILEVYAVDGLTKSLLHDYKYTEPQLTIALQQIEDFNERPWHYPEAYEAVKQTIYAKRRSQIPSGKTKTFLQRSDHVESYQPKPISKEESTRRSMKNKATRQANRIELERIQAIADSFPKDRFAGVDNNSYFSSGLNGCHSISVYIEQSMSDDVYGFGDIKAIQTLDEDIESLYAYYEDYIF